METVASGANMQPMPSPATISGARNTYHADAGLAMSAIVPIDRKSTRLNSSHTVIYTLSLHDALPICQRREYAAHAKPSHDQRGEEHIPRRRRPCNERHRPHRSEEHTSELQSHSDLHSFPTRRSSDLPAARICSPCQAQPRSAGRGTHTTPTPALQ